MPIDYKKYPKNWKEIRERILERANNTCEVCGKENGEEFHSFKENNFTIWRWLSYTEWIRRDCPKIVKVVLTIAHLDHDETNHDVKDERLMAMCQLCHLRYDAHEKKRRLKDKRSN